MEVTNTYKAKNRAAWRAWLESNHASEKEIWLLFDDREEVPTVSYLDAVEEAICFGWIDGIAKRHGDFERAQRFTPRRRKSNWTELNKERARRLERLGLMTDAGRAVLPDLSQPFVIAPDIVKALKAGGAWEQFEAFPELYRRVRVGYVEDGRREKVEFERRLLSLVSKTAAGKMFGNWDDDGRLS